MCRGLRTSDGLRARPYAVTTRIVTAAPTQAWAGNSGTPFPDEVSTLDVALDVLLVELEVVRDEDVEEVLEVLPLPAGPGIAVTVLSPKLAMYAVPVRVSIATADGSFPTATVNTELFDRLIIEVVLS